MIMGLLGYYSADAIYVVWLYFDELHYILSELNGLKVLFG